MKVAAKAAPKLKKTNRFPGAVKNILAIYAEATQAEIEGGLSWYQDAHNFAAVNAAKFGLTVEVVAGIVSALSPGTDWDRNKADALQVLAGNEAHQFGTYGHNVRKAFEIRKAGQDARVEAFFPSDKTFNFYHNIVNPSAGKYVTIDRHALSVGIGATRVDKTVTKVEYRELARHYNLAAKKLGILPQQVQAVTWVVWRNRKGLKSKYCLADILAQRTSVSFGK